MSPSLSSAPEELGRVVGWAIETADCRPQKSRTSRRKSSCGKIYWTMSRMSCRG